MSVDERGDLSHRGIVGRVCPHCGARLDHSGLDGVDGPIAFETEDHRGTLYYACPACHLAWTELRGTGPLAELSARHVADHNAGVHRALEAEPGIRAGLRRVRGDVEQVLDRAGASRPLGWSYGPWAPMATLFVVRQWCCLSRSDAERTWMRAEDRLARMIGCPVVLSEMSTDGVGAMTCLQALAGAEPWGDVDPAWARVLVDAMQQGRITWPELAAQMVRRLRAVMAG